ncbi:MAG: hypothetical protein DCF22_14425 [Leptolyngbya sp.]|nr:MAG: hypothetical protein DCF22_14425 [Leptolyngbya sp.]
MILRCSTLKNVIQHWVKFARDGGLMVVGNRTIELMEIAFAEAFYYRLFVIQYSVLKFVKV